MSINLYCLVKKDVGIPISEKVILGYNYFLSENVVVEPLPYYDLGNDLGKFFRAEKYKERDNWLFGFKCREDLLDLFDIDYLESICKFFEIYRVLIKKDLVTFGEVQCIFYKDDIDKIEKIDIYSFLYKDEL